MRIRFLTFTASAVLALSCVASDCVPPPVAVFYSFDRPPDPALFAELRNEFARIMKPTAIPLVWRDSAAPGNTDFADLYVVRFRGTCSMETAVKEQSLSADHRSLAETSVSDGRVLPFADIRCDSIRRYLASGSVATMARAMARVTAHEMYHMMTGRAAHCDHGVAKAEFSLDNLTADRFVFSAGETEMLRATSALRPIRNSL